MASVLTAAPALEPVTLAEANAHLRLATDDEDAVISRLIIAARRHMEAHTGLALIAQGWSHFRDAWPDGPAVALPLGPVLSVESVTLHDGSGGSAVVDPALYRTDAVSHPARLLLLQAIPPPGQAGNGIEIALTIGFGAAAIDVPADIVQAMLDLVAHWHAQRGDDKQTALPLTVSAVTERYREKRL